ncbi:MAG: lysozyme inhibitor LprI family protein [Halothece sp.]
MVKVLGWVLFLGISVSLISCSPSETSQVVSSIATPQETSVNQESLQSENADCGNAETEPLNICTASETSPIATPEETVISEAENIDCSNPQTQTEMNICAGSSAKKADDQLNAVYQELRKEISGTPQEQRLIKAQQKWIAFRDADCDYARKQYEGGSIEPTIYAGCIADSTEQRTKDLEAYLEQARL